MLQKLIKSLSLVAASTALFMWIYHAATSGTLMSAIINFLFGAVAAIIVLSMLATRYEKDHKEDCR